MLKIVETFDCVLAQFFRSHEWDAHLDADEGARGGCHHWLCQKNSRLSRICWHNQIPQLNSMFYPILSRSNHLLRGNQEAQQQEFPRAWGVYVFHVHVLQKIAESEGTKTFTPPMLTDNLAVLRSQTCFVPEILTKIPGIEICQTSGKATRHKNSIYELAEFSSF